MISSDPIDFVNCAAQDHRTILINRRPLSQSPSRSPHRCCKLNIFRDFHVPTSTLNHKPAPGFPLKLTAVLHLSSPSSAALDLSPPHPQSFGSCNPRAWAFACRRASLLFKISSRRGGKRWWKRSRVGPTPNITGIPIRATLPLAAHNKRKCSRFSLIKYY